MNRTLRPLFTSAMLTTGALLQAQIIFSEDFDGMGGPTAGGAGTYAFPAGWMLVNVDNRTPAASVSYVNEAWERREDFSFNVADSAAFSASWYTPAGGADDWMWTPAMTITANNILSWNAIAYDPLYPDGYEVRIMVAPNNPTGTTGNIGNMVTQSTVLFSTVAEASAWTPHSVNLSTYAGQSVRIGFRNNSNDKFLLLIDDVLVEQQLNIDAQMLVADTATEYTIIPVAQGMPLNFNGVIRNNGLNGLVDARAEVTVLRDGVQVFQDYSTAVGLAPAATTAWTAPSYTPTEVGEHLVRFVAQQGNGIDELPANDTLYQSFLVTDSIYARDNGVVTGSLGIGAGVVGYIGQSFTTVQDAALTSISFYVTRGYANRQAAAVVWSTVGGVPDQIIAGTDTLLYPDDSARFYTLPLSIPEWLTAGEYALTLVEFDSTLALGQTSALFTNGTTWVNWPGSPFGGWANAEEFGPNFSKSFVVRANFGDACADIAGVMNVVNATCATCADGSVSVTVTGDNGGLNYQWNTGDTSPALTGLLPGPYSVEVIDQFGCVLTLSDSVDFSTGALETIGALGMVVSPNPSNGPFSVRLNFAQATAVDLELYTAQGRLAEAKHVAAHTSGEVLFSTVHAPGNYTLWVRTSKGSLAEPISLVR